MTFRGEVLGVRVTIEGKRPAWAPRFLDSTMRTLFSSKHTSAFERGRNSLTQDSLEISNYIPGKARVGIEPA